MAVVIRLQGLRVTAGSEDIRRFFTGLKIPDGGVHIIGGERDEAFIIFASDEDARRAMIHSGGVIRGSPVTFLLSSKAEFQNMLERTTKIVERDQKRRLEDDIGHPRRSMEPEMGRRSASRSGDSPPPLLQRAPNTDDVFLFLKGLPFSVTEKEIFVLVKNRQGLNNGTGFVKFATREDAMEGLKRDREYIGARYIEISTTTLNDWHRVTGRMPTAVIGGSFQRGRSPIPDQRDPQHCARSRSPVAQRHIAPSEGEYCVLLENLSFAAEKEHIKRLFHNAKLGDDQILHLIDSDGKQKRSALVLFKSLRDYLHTRPVSRENMIALLKPQGTTVRPSGNSERFREGPASYSSDPYDSEKICVFVRNLPFDVRKVEIIDFFLGFNITEDNVCVLQDREGAGVGQALVVFGSETEALRALILDGRRFLGSKVILKCITRSEMQELGVDPPVVQEPLLRGEQYSGKSSEASYLTGDTSYPDFRVPRDGGIPVTNAQDSIHGSIDYESRAARSRSPEDRGNGVRGSFRSPVEPFDTPTCVQLLNLPFQIRSEEIYDFCYGYRIIPGSVSLQYDQSGKPKGSATLVFESRREALTAVEELGGRPIGQRKIKMRSHS
uniref:RNA binding motif protein 12Bb n=1 Tax=Maylandia zebra TaxID=106582 RepID=A0A3P9CCG7_9CICH